MNLTEQKKTKSWVVPILSVVIVILVFSLGFILGRTGFNVAWKDGDISYSIKGTLFPEKKDIKFDLFWEIWDMLERQYVDPALEEQDMFYGAIKGMVAGIGDPATLFYTPEDTEAYETARSGKLEGVGIELAYKNNQVFAKKILENSPASQSDISVGDIIIAVDGEEVEGWVISEVASHIRGEKGTKVVLTVQRDGKEEGIDIEIVRDEVYYEAINWEMLDNDIALISINRFTEDSLEKFFQVWDGVIAEVEYNNASGIIIDLRGNGGGFLDGGVYVAGEFLDKGKTVLYVEDRSGKRTPKKVDRKGTYRDIPLVILVDERTASASEIFAGALQVHERAVLLGQTTYGKGTAQDVIKPSAWDGASIHITTQKWLLPNKVWINHEDPVEPDEEVDITVEEIRNGDDPQLDRAKEKIQEILTNQ